ncbi:MAG: FMN-binding protein, partial [Pirellulales bacterium]|nr:FMN-binding protein [Pirellulales bacterium]
EPAFRDQFRDMPTDQPIVVVTSTPTTTSQIRSVTGATISSASVAELVNRAMETLRIPIQRYWATQK